MNSTNEFCKRVIKYVLLAVIVVLAAMVLPKNKISNEAALSIGLVAAATFAILDMFTVTPCNL